MDLSEDSRMQLWSFEFVMIYIIHRILVFLKNHLNYLEDNAFLRSIIDFYFSKKTFFFFVKYNGGKYKAWRRKHN